jgi:hypothetical protein
MASYTWKGVSGDWNLAGDWTPAGGPPKSTDSATINGTATDTITVDTADVANSRPLGRERHPQRRRLVRLAGHRRHAHNERRSAQHLA